jgi:arsenite methyltransferase
VSHMAPRFVAVQLSRPTGFAGRLIAWLMNWTNAAINVFAVKQLELKPADRVLEIGFGGGVTLPSLLRGASFVGGVDRSPDVVKRAKQKFPEDVRAGRADFRVGTAEALPFEAGSFEKACTVNTVYFWTSLRAGFAEIHRVLSPGGRVVVGFLPKENMDRMDLPTDVFKTRSPDDVIAALVETGFFDVRCERPKLNTAWVVIVATR